jgi:hypothetical protein
MVSFRVFFEGNIINDPISWPDFPFPNLGHLTHVEEGGKKGN